MSAAIQIEHTAWVDTQWDIPALSMAALAPANLWTSGPADPVDTWEAHELFAFDVP